ncbi:hypothetical protein EN788_14765 [Mesorhizobium sp. M2D.F.Ca.ET.145.01.1.1]|nr:hypothetical protein EN803_27455 [Mesorhizobium sp. M2D.F.Ca.ET.160.01.1.1]TGV78410.1 hypothetical protein EN792_045730 [Mesorhizobium sp. M00.F.Ca.ET.149.01.1.1]TGW11882.1 hypothetical protein EN788_14765 [Mesorhizobium sp. M2D.F.Ca.ET.145.01.1.1]
MSIALPVNRPLVSSHTRIREAAEGLTGRKQVPLRLPKITRQALCIHSVPAGSFAMQPPKFHRSSLARETHM